MAIVTDNSAPLAARAETLANSPIFDAFVRSPENANDDGTINWNFVFADLHVLFGDMKPADFDAVLDAAADLYMEALRASVEILKKEG